MCGVCMRASAGLLGQCVVNPYCILIVKHKSI
uniref:Uncharacterized protein n=1 Tax=Arundo donax TaxID=35708 RepID=A0A0A8YMA6_ARUDO